jgi:predicted permease
MLLARGLSRRREIAIRLSIGAGRARLIQQLLTESIVLSAFGAAAGLMLAQAAIAALMSMIPLRDVGAHQIDLSPDGTVFLYTMAVALLTAVIFGLLPAFRSLRFDLTPALKSEGLLSAGQRGSGRLQNGLIAVQVAVSLVLLINAGLLIRGFRQAFEYDTGQDTRNLLVVDLDLRQQQYTGAEATRFVTSLRETLSTRPGIVAASNTFVEPLHEQCGRPASIGGADFIVSCDEIGPDYFRAAGIPLLHGREFNSSEAAGANPVAIVDAAFAREKLGSENAVGRSFRSGNQELQVVGVVGTTRPLDLTSRSAPKIYVPMRGLRHNEAKLLVRYDASAREAAEAIRTAAGALDPNVNAGVRRVEDTMDSALTPIRIAAASASGLGSFALVLAATGIYGVVAFAISRRRREVGIRMALGADRGSVLRLVLWQGMKPVLAGGIIGLMLAGGASQLIRAMLYGISPLDPVSFAGTGLMQAIVALAAMAVPARQALLTDPSVTLRQD